MLACARQPAAVLEVSRTIRTAHTTYGNPRIVVRVEVDVYRYWDSWKTLELSADGMDHDGHMNEDCRMMVRQRMEEFDASGVLRLRSTQG